MGEEGLGWRNLRHHSAHSSQSPQQYPARPAGGGRRELKRNSEMQHLNVFSKWCLNDLVISAVNAGNAQRWTFLKKKDNVSFIRANPSRGSCGVTAAVTSGLSVSQSVGQQGDISLQNKSPDGCRLYLIVFV